MKILTPRYKKILISLIDEKWRELNRQADSMNTPRREVNQLIKKMDELENIARNLDSRIN